MTYFDGQGVAQGVPVRPLARGARQALGKVFPAHHMRAVKLLSASASSVTSSGITTATESFAECIELLVLLQVLSGAGASGATTLRLDLT